MVNKKTHYIDFENYEERCKDIANEILSNKNIKDIFGIPKAGIIPATRIAYLTNLPLNTTCPRNDSTAIIDDVLETGKTRHSFGNFLHFFPLVDKQYEDMNVFVTFWWEKKLK